MDKDIRTEDNFLVGEHYSQMTGDKEQNFRNMLINVLRWKCRIATYALDENYARNFVHLTSIGVQLTDELFEHIYDSLYMLKAKLFDLYRAIEYKNISIPEVRDRFEELLTILKDLREFTHEHITRFKSDSKWVIEYDDDYHYAPLNNMIYTFMGIVHVIDIMNGVYELDDGQVLWDLDPEYFKVRLKLFGSCK